jgi:hypothetical protein
LTNFPVLRIVKTLEGECLRDYRPMGLSKLAAKAARKDMDE